jgi:hypothetical protein
LTPGYYDYELKLDQDNKIIPSEVPIIDVKVSELPCPIKWKDKSKENKIKADIRK